MTPEQEAKANEAANIILAELRAASSPDECAEIGKRTSKVFDRLNKIHNVRAIHIINLAALKKMDFEREREKENDMQMQLW